MQHVLADQDPAGNPGAGQLLIQRLYKVEACNVSDLLALISNWG